MARLLLGLVFSCLSGTELPTSNADEKAHITDDLIFYAGFEGTLEAQVYVKDGDGRVYTADTPARKKLEPGMHIPEVSIASKAGRHGDALRFAAKSDTVLCYKASVNGMQPTDHWSGTVSLWLRLSPDPDLPAGYCDPLQITSKKWNDAAFFVDFDQTLPRDFRLGAFSDHDFWNPSQIKWDDIPAQDRPMIVVKPPSFSREKWTHVAFTFENLNSTRGDAASTHLYIDGKLQGSLHKPMQFTWSGTESREAIMMLGINYVGDMDELAIYKRALSAGQIQQLFMHPEEYAGRPR